MYHPGKVMEIFSSKDKNIKSADATTQALLEMWDENMITVLVESQISKDIKKGDIVLVDYRPMQTSPTPKLTVTKILRGSSAKETWNIYRDHFRKQKNRPVIQKVGAITPAQSQASEQHYVG
jgi:hypothetical protein